MTPAEQPPVPENLWTAATHAQTGKSLEVALEEALKFRPELDRDDPIHAAFLTGMGYLLNLAHHQLASIRVRGFKRNLASETEKIRNELEALRQEYREATMPVKDQQVTEKLEELGVWEIAKRLRIVRGSFEICIHLRSKGIDARFSQERVITVPTADYERASKLTTRWLECPTDWLAEGRQLIGRAA